MAIYLSSRKKPIHAMQTKSTLIPSELKSLLPNGCCLIDVREPVEYAEEHIPGSQLIPLGQLEQQLPKIDRSKPLVVMCGSGKRGGEALKKLASLGIHNAQNLEGGILAWKAAGFSVRVGDKMKFPLMQQVQLTIGLGVLIGAVLSLTVHPNWVCLCAFFGAGLTFAGSTGWCGLAILMSKMPWNRVPCQSCCGAGK
jgi:rhodanese-related sulfurtransferase